MFFHILSKRTRLWLPILLAGMSVLAGCLADTNPVVQVVPRVVLAPQNPRFLAPVEGYVTGSTNPPLGSMKVIWHRSIADTQLNFKGYLVKLFTAAPDTVNKIDTIAESGFLTSVNVYRTGLLIPDTTYTFTSIPGHPQGIPLGLYGVVIYGIKSDSTSSLSSDSAVYAGLFDPLPFSNPSNLMAESAGPTQVKLHWTPSPQENDIGFYRYVIYYRDTTKIPFDTGLRNAIYLPTKLTPGWNDSEHVVSVPGVTPVGTSTSEWPYQFWIKAERNDSTFFYGSDTNSIIWAGAERIPRAGNDTGLNLGYLQVKNNQTIFIGSVNGQFDMEIDSSDKAGQIIVTIGSDNSVTLTIQSTSNGHGFMSRMDFDSSLDSIYYSGPLNDPSQFSDTSITLTPDMASNGGVILYLMMDDNQIKIPYEWARLFIHTQSNGGFINSHGAVDFKASFQPAVSKDGSAHLPYY